MRHERSFSVASAIALALGAPLLPAADFPLKIAGRVDRPRPDSTVQVLLERDDSKRWQQYLDSSALVIDAAFQIPVQRPGLYWLIATEETDWSYRRGACLVEVRKSGDYSLKAVPDTKVGRKWGGPKATGACQRGVVPLTLYRSKRSAPIQKR